MGSQFLVMDLVSQTALLDRRGRDRLCLPMEETNALLTPSADARRGVRVVALVRPGVFPNVRASRHDTGILSSVLGGTSTVMLTARFCLPPRKCSPSTIRTGVSVGLTANRESTAASSSSRTSSSEEGPVLISGNSFAGR